MLFQLPKNIIHLLSHTKKQKPLGPSTYRNETNGSHLFDEDVGVRRASRFSPAVDVVAAATAAAATASTDSAGDDSPHESVV